MIFVVVLVFIARRAIDLWKSAPPESISIHVGWLIPAGLAYFVGWLPSVWVWKRFLEATGNRIRWWTALRAYYASHLGKYIPGKALALVIRGAMVEEDGANPLLAGITAACETIVFIAAGGALALILSPRVLGRAPVLGSFASTVWLQEHWLLLAFVVMVATFATTPFSSWFFTRICRKAAGRDDKAEGRRQKAENKEAEIKISAGLVSQGVMATSVGWLFHALSLGFVLQSLSSEPIDFAQFPVWLASCTLSLVGGFIVLIAPGGLGVREGILIEALKDQPSVGPTMAILAAGILRAVWFVTELLVAGVLFVAGSRPRVNEVVPARRD
jgi:hypothetical protein